MPLLKPLRGTQLNRTHPLTRSLGMFWLFNEHSGAKVFDLTGNNRMGALQGAPSWAEGRFGSALYYNGNDDSVETSSPVITQAPVSVSLWFKADELPSIRAQDGTLLIQRTVGSPYQSFRVLINDADDKTLLLIYNSSGVNTVSISSDSAIQTGVWYHAVIILDSDYDACMYVNGVQQTATGYAGSIYSPNDVLRLGSRTGTADNFKGKIDNVMIFDRVLSASEIKLLGREPFCMLRNPIRPGAISTASTEISLSGSAGTQCSVSGSLTLQRDSSEIPESWQRETLLNGMTSVALKLGTTLSLGWFWFRVTGCSALYRGPSLEQVDFNDLLTVAERHARQVSPPGYVPHNSDSAYTYVVRRFNERGYQEETLAASARISLDSGGKLQEPKPNKISILKAELIEGGRARLVWFYCPIDQESEPASFKVYYNSGTGQIDFDNELATIPYEGLKFYHYKSAPLGGAKYVFTVRAEDADGTEDGSSNRLNVELNAAKPNSINILSTARL